MNCKHNACASNFPCIYEKMLAKFANSRLDRVASIESELFVFRFLKKRWSISSASSVDDATDAASSWLESLPGSDCDDAPLFGAMVARRAGGEL